MSVRDNIAHVVLNRPDKLNALDPAMMEALVQTGTELRDRKDVAVVVVSGAGRAFCSGLDLSQFDQMRERRAADVVVLGDRLGAARALGQKAVHVWSLISVPVVAAVHGVAIGGGLQLALGADIRIATPDSQWSVMEIRWGIIPDMTGTQLLPEIVGRDRAKELTFTGRRIDGSTAAEIGMVTTLADDPLSAAFGLAEEIATHPRNALCEAKRLLDLSGRVPLTDGFDAEQDAIAALMGSEEQVAAVNGRLGPTAKLR
ncbi:crotonase/enoyl-CoA hydratase family protein [Rhodococcus sp. T2V]|uniref:crotonase/enoyl-CoA hydratase family protein n=1 Tax=Rhodococcus sp. T2V TaxID=3034164 RepID=UPI0023E2C715|nr:crotonase/enoyl-CoA hydratase family protein [Rhodococcus sp. T2V]MDF3312203.1 crotonase/enoyl-CoA hydratase family protein [Rhodococcus sp. T2V]